MWPNLIEYREQKRAAGRDAVLWRQPNHPNVSTQYTISDKKYVGKMGDEFSPLHGTCHNMAKVDLLFM